MKLSTSKKRNIEYIIRDNACDFLNAGLSLLFNKAADSSDIKLSIVAIQTSIELLAKFRMTRDQGIESIIVGHKLPSAPILKSEIDGRFRTISYSECLKSIRLREELTSTDNRLIKELQDLRNALVHFAADIDIAKIRQSTAWLLVRALAMFAAGQDRDVGEFQNYRGFLKEINFAALTNFGPYRAEAVEAAVDSPDSESVFRCWECKEDALSLRGSGTYFCYCCGLTAVEECATFTDCMLCRENNGIFYDPLNTTNGFFRGRCLFCESFIWLLPCDICGRFFGAREMLSVPSCQYCPE
jgi:hypothetical protein